MGTFSQDHLSVLGVAVLLVNWTILCPLCAYYSVSYFKHSKILHHRRPESIRFNLCIACYFLLIAQTLSIIEVFDLAPSIPTLGVIFGEGQELYSFPAETPKLYTIQNTG